MPEGCDVKGGFRREITNPDHTFKKLDVKEREETQQWLEGSREFRIVMNTLLYIK